MSLSTWPKKTAPRSSSRPERFEFTGITNSFAGTISGPGEFALGSNGVGCFDLIAPGAKIAARGFSISGGNLFVTLGEDLSYAGAFSLEAGAVLDPGGFTLTLSGTDTLSATINGSGTLVTARGSSTSINGFTLGGAVDWQNSGTVDALGTEGNLTIGDASFAAAQFTNEKGGVYDLLNNSVIEIAAGSPSTTISRFVNEAGATVEKASGTGDSFIQVNFINDGNVLAGSGTLEFQTAVAGSGSYPIEPGAVLQFDAAVASGASVDFATTKGGELLLEDSQGFAAAIRSFGGSDTDEIDLRDINFSGTSFRLVYRGTTKEGVLTVTDGTHTTRLTMFGDYKTADFKASADVAGGTAIFGVPAHATLLASAR